MVMMIMNAYIWVCMLYTALANQNSASNFCMDSARVPTYMHIALDIYTYTYIYTIATLTSCVRVPVFILSFLDEAVAIAILKFIINDKEIKGLPDQRSRRKLSANLYLIKINPQSRILLQPSYGSRYQPSSIHTRVPPGRI